MRKLILLLPLILSTAAFAADPAPSDTVPRAAAQGVITEVQRQRNEAFDALADARGQIATQAQQIQDLQAKVAAAKPADTSPPSVPSPKPDAPK